MPLLLGTLYLCWGSSFLAIELVVRDAPALLSAGIRFTLAGAVLFLAVVPRRGIRALIPRRGDLFMTVVLALLLITLGNGGVVAAQRQGIPSWLAALLVATIPVWIAIFRFIWGPTPHRITLWGTAIGLCGTAALVSTAGLRLTGFGPIALGLAGALGWAVAAFVSARRGGAQDPFVTAVQQLLIGGTGLLIASVILESGEWNTTRWTVSSIAGLAWLTVASSIIALVVFYRITALTSVSVASTYAFTNPIVAMVLSIVILGVFPDVISVLAAPFVIAGVALVIWGDRRKDSVRDYTIS